jgi:methyl-accepting chemotaxis protein
MEEQDVGANQILSAVNQVVSSSQENQSTVQELLNKSEEIGKQMKELEQRSAHINDATREQNESNMHIIKVIDGVRNFSQENMGIANALKKIFQTFKV